MAIVSGPTIIGGGIVQTYVDAGSNDANGIAQTLANVISAGLQSSPAAYARTNGPAPGIGNGVYTLSTPNAGVSLQPGVGVALVAGGGSSAAPGTSATVAGSGGAGEILLGDNENITYNTGGGSGTVIMGDGNNFVGTPLSGFAGSSFNITTGTGNDLIIAGVGTNSVSAGGGNNTIFTVVASDTIYSSGNDIISGLFGQAGEQDTIYQTTGSVFVGEGFKNLLFVGSNATATVLSGQGSYTINGGAGSNLIGGGSAGNNVLGGGTGSVGSTLFGGGNGDLLLARGSGTNFLNAGAGNETLSGSFSTGGNYFYTGSGNDVISGGPGNDVYFAGSGNSTINSGSGGSDIVGIRAGLAGGTVVLNNFNTSTQKVELQGYGANEAANDVANQTQSGSSAVVKLSDNTTITFSGIGHVDLSTFS